MTCGVLRDVPEALGDGVVPNRDTTVGSAAHPILADDVGDVDIAFDRDELHCPEHRTELDLPVTGSPSAVLHLRAQPSFRESDHEPRAPTPYVVAAVGDDLETLSLGTGGVSGDVPDGGGLFLGSAHSAYTLPRLRVAARGTKTVARGLLGRDEIGPLVSEHLFEERDH